MPEILKFCQADYNVLSHLEIVVYLESLESLETSETLENPAIMSKAS